MSRVIAETHLFNIYILIAGTTLTIASYTLILAMAISKTNRIQQFVLMVGLLIG